MNYKFECEDCKDDSIESFKMIERPDYVICKLCGGKAVRVMSAPPHIGEKVKGTGGGSSKGLKGF